MHTQYLINFLRGIYGLFVRIFRTLTTREETRTKGENRKNRKNRKDRKGTVYNLDGSKYGK